MYLQNKPTQKNNIENKSYMLIWFTVINQNDKHEFQIPKSKGYLPGHFSSYFALIINWDYHKQYEQPKYPEIQISQIKKYIKKANFFTKMVNWKMVLTVAPWKMGGRRWRRESKPR